MKMRLTILDLTQENENEPQRAQRTQRDGSLKEFSAASQSNGINNKQLQWDIFICYSSKSA
ncbi:hypothetical protein I8748_13570 [Nostoc sp. CENA67]|uniref:Uncharacterized protein n=1 Tax=Amazonocrinis nigriterrae CENA67 TaxID=2794033 RepID=A0A8J7HNZ3_9NOST|nr:hypothetical protein [Amazonocrinis nigriterrae]MBH8563201.1 hypothetical protein [Amazonocrinis nigriterrae CENA67]